MHRPSSALGGMGIGMNPNGYAGQSPMQPTMMSMTQAQAPTPGGSGMEMGHGGHGHGHGHVSGDMMFDSGLMGGMGMGMGMGPGAGAGFGMGMGMGMGDVPVMSGAGGENADEYWNTLIDGEYCLPLSRSGYLVTLRRSADGDRYTWYD